MSTPLPPSPALGARARARLEVTTEILEAARRQLAEHGAAALSLRAVAREVGMVSSAVYRYFPSRDDLLTRLILDAYGALADAAESADGEVERTDVAGRFVATATAIRTWAVAHPHEYALLYGTPVPGYAAPPDTVDPVLRLSGVMLGILADGVAAGTISTDERIETTRAVRSDLAGLRRLAPGVPDVVLARGLAAWTQLFGHLNFELFGHFRNVVSDDAGFFDLQVRRTAASILGR